jgi:hypothetical protein
MCQESEKFTALGIVRRASLSAFRAVFAVPRPLASGVTAKLYPRSFPEPPRHDAAATHQAVGRSVVEQSSRANEYILQARRRCHESMELLETTQLRIEQSERRIRDVLTRLLETSLRRDNEWRPGNE